MRSSILEHRVKHLSKTCALFLISAWTASSHAHDIRLPMLNRVLPILLILIAGLGNIAHAQTYKVVYNFPTAGGGTNALVQGINGNLYGTSNSSDGGSVIELTATGTVKTIYQFCSLPNCADGFQGGGLVLGSDGNLYGVTISGGANSNLECGDEGIAASCGTVFKLTPTGKLTTLYSFCSQPGCTDGIQPATALTQGYDGNFYGMTSFGGSGGACAVYETEAPQGCGTIFRITPEGALTTLYSFCVDSCADGWDPTGNLVLSVDGNFYGTTNAGGIGSGCPYSSGCGTIFRISPKGALKSLYSFCILTGCPDGTHPGGLVLGTNGVFYGTAGDGGANNYGTVFAFKQSQSKLSTMYSFCSKANCADGSYPDVGLIQANDGTLYGTAFGGQSPYCLYGCGVLFMITPAGTYKTRYDFCSKNVDCFDGAIPFSPLFQSTTGAIYGFASGGESGNGLIYKWTDAKELPPFVYTAPTAGDVGNLVKILGNDLTDASAVTFNGVDATFEVVSSTEITATVPSGATSGHVEVVTPTASLSSNVSFVVR